MTKQKTNSLSDAASSPRRASKRACRSPKKKCGGESSKYEYHVLSGLGTDMWPQYETFPTMDEMVEWLRICPTTEGVMIFCGTRLRIMHPEYAYRVCVEDPNGKAVPVHAKDDVPIATDDLAIRPKPPADTAWIRALPIEVIEDVLHQMALEAERLRKRNQQANADRNTINGVTQSPGGTEIASAQNVNIDMSAFGVSTTHEELETDDGQFAQIDTSPARSETSQAQTAPSHEIAKRCPRRRAP